MGARKVPTNNFNKMFINQLIKSNTTYSEGNTNLSLHIFDFWCLFFTAEIILRWLVGIFSNQIKDLLHYPLIFQQWKIFRPAIDFFAVERFPWWLIDFCSHLYIFRVTDRFLIHLKDFLVHWYIFLMMWKNSLTFDRFLWLSKYFLSWS